MQKPRDPNWGLHKGDSSRVLTPRSTEAQRPQPRLGPGLHGDHITGHQVPPRTGVGGPASREGKGSRPWVTRVPGQAPPGPAGRALSAEEPLRQGEASSHLRCSLCDSDLGSGTARFHKTSILKAIRQVQN